MNHYNYHLHLILLSISLSLPTATSANISNGDGYYNISDCYTSTTCLFVNPVECQFTTDLSPGLANLTVEYVGPYPTTRFTTAKVNVEYMISIGTGSIEMVSVDTIGKTITLGLYDDGYGACAKANKPLKYTAYNNPIAVPPTTLATVSTGNCAIVNGQCFITLAASVYNDYSYVTSECDHPDLSIPRGISSPVVIGEINRAMSFYPIHDGGFELHVGGLSGKGWADNATYWRELNYANGHYGYSISSAYSKTGLNSLRFSPNDCSNVPDCFVSNVVPGYLNLYTPIQLTFDYMSDNIDIDYLNQINIYLTTEQQILADSLAFTPSNYASYPNAIQLVDTSSVFGTGYTWYSYSKQTCSQLIHPHQLFVFSFNDIFPSNYYFDNIQATIGSSDNCQPVTLSVSSSLGLPYSYVNGSLTGHYFDFTLTGTSSYPTDGSISLYLTDAADSNNHFATYSFSPSSSIISSTSNSITYRYMFTDDRDLYPGQNTFTFKYNPIDWTFVSTDSDSLVYYSKPNPPNVYTTITYSTNVADRILNVRMSSYICSFEYGQPSTDEKFNASYAFYNCNKQIITSATKFAYSPINVPIPFPTALDNDYAYVRVQCSLKVTPTQLSDFIPIRVSNYYRTQYYNTRPTFSTNPSVDILQNEPSTSFQLTVSDDIYGGCQDSYDNHGAFSFILSAYNYYDTLVYAIPYTAPVGSSSYTININTVNINQSRIAYYVAKCASGQLPQSLPFVLHLYEAFIPSDATSPYTPSPIILANSSSSTGENNNPYGNDPASNNNNNLATDFTRMEPGSGLFYVIVVGVRWYSYCWYSSIR